VVPAAVTACSKSGAATPIRLNTTANAAIVAQGGIQVTNRLDCGLETEFACWRLLVDGLWVADRFGVFLAMVWLACFLALVFVGCFGTGVFLLRLS